MGRRTGNEPNSSQTFLWRICHALDIPPKELAREIGVDYQKDLAPLLAERRHVVEIDRDETWWLISDFVARRTGLLMAIKLELDRALQKDRAARVTRQKRFDRFHDDRES